MRDSSKMFDDMNAIAKAKDMSAAQMMATLKYSGIEYQMADMLLGGDLTGPLDRLSVQGFVSDKIAAQLRKWDDYSVLGGYDLLLQNMVAEIGAQNIRFGHPVKAIRPLANGWVQIQVPGVGWFTSRTALCTASIGALHARKIDFGPFWTSEKEASLRFIDTFDQSKFAIRFKERFWPEDMTMLHHALSSERKAGRTYFVANYDYGSVPPVLTAYITGEVAQRFHSMTDKDILQLICADLDKIYPALAPTYNRVAYYQNGLPIVYRKQWIDDPFSHGGMSFLQTGEASAGVSVTTARLALASAQNTKPLFWAGEATETETQPACVHGAHNSGLRASREILNHLLRG